MIQCTPIAEESTTHGLLPVEGNILLYIIQVK